MSLSVCLTLHQNILYAWFCLHTVQCLFEVSDDHPQLIDTAAAAAAVDFVVDLYSINPNR